jgi:hypothetical protein
MANNARLAPLGTPAGYLLAPLQPSGEGTPLKICVLVKSATSPATTPVAGPFVLLREVPGSRVYLGAVCDAGARIQEWVEIQVQSHDVKDMAFASYQEQLSNHVFDQRWRAECAAAREALPDRVIETDLEHHHPGPLLVLPPSPEAPTPLAVTEPLPWKLCTDDALLTSLGLPPYSVSPHRYLLQTGANETKTFAPASADAPTNAHVQSADRFLKLPGALAVFNPGAGMLRIMRFSPLGLETFLRILEGAEWDDAAPEMAGMFPGSQYAKLRTWSASPKGLPFLLHGGNGPGDRLNEISFLKLSALCQMFKEVRTCVGAHQLPLLNLSPASFQVSLPEAGEQFPALWAAKCVLVKPGQAYPLKISSTEQKYFIRLGRVEPSPYFPEGVGAHSFGIGSIRIRNILKETDGTVLEGTLVAEDYLGLDPHDLLWFKLPLGELKLEFFAHVYTAEAVGPREARFRTVPVQLAEEVAEPLQRTAGAVFARSPYEIWPLLSSPCDLYSLGVMAVRMLLANSKSNLPVVLDEVMGLSRHLGKMEKSATALRSELDALLEKEPRLLDLTSPHQLVESGYSPAEARKSIHMDLWLESVAFLLRLFPGAGAHSFCKDLGDVSPLALETLFDQPIEELERLLCRYRSVLLPGLSANEEIASVILDVMQ